MPIFGKNSCLVCASFKPFSCLALSRYNPEWMLWRRQ